MLQLAEFHANAQVSVKSKKPSLKERKQKLLAFLQGTTLPLTFVYVGHEKKWPFILSQSDKGSANYFLKQRGMNQFVLGGQQNGVPCVDG